VRVLSGDVCPCRKGGSIVTSRWILSIPQRLCALHRSSFHMAALFAAFVVSGPPDLAASLATSQGASSSGHATVPNRKIVQNPAIAQYEESISLPYGFLQRRRYLASLSEDGSGSGEVGPGSGEYGSGDISSGGGDDAGSGGSSSSGEEEGFSGDAVGDVGSGAFGSGAAIVEPLPPALPLPLWPPPVSPPHPPGAPPSSPPAPLLPPWSPPSPAVPGAIEVVRFSIRKASSGRRSLLLDDMAASHAVTSPIAVVATSRAHDAVEVLPRPVRSLQTSLTWSEPELEALASSVASTLSLSASAVFASASGDLAEVTIALAEPAVISRATAIVATVNDAATFIAAIIAVDPALGVLSLQLVDTAILRMALLPPLAPPPPPSPPPSPEPLAPPSAPPAPLPSTPPAPNLDSWQVPVGIGLGVLAGIIVLCCFFTGVLLYVRHRGWARGEQAIVRAQFSDSPVDSAPGRRRGTGVARSGNPRHPRKKRATVAPACETYAPSTAESPCGQQAYGRRARVPAPGLSDGGETEMTRTRVRKPPRSFEPNYADYKQSGQERMRQPAARKAVRAAPTATPDTTPACAKPRAVHPRAQLPQQQVKDGHSSSYGHRRAPSLPARGPGANR
jgi:hypothetical protein